MTQPDIKNALRYLLEACGRLDIPCMVVGSVASSIHGVTRSTMDVDLVAALDEAKIDALARALEGEFYADPVDMKEALRRGGAFNLIHYSSSYKFDIFPLTADPFAQAEFARRRKATLPQTQTEQALELPVASEEDTILSKLLWYKASAETSERQWTDAVGIVRACGSRLDRRYMEVWAARLEIQHLLSRLLETSA